MNTQTQYVVDKGGRPKKWFLPLTSLTIPRKYAAALLEIALEWQENEELNQITDD